METKRMHPLVYRAQLFDGLRDQVQEWVYYNKVSHSELSQDLRIELNLYVIALRIAREHKDVDRYILELEIYLNDIEQAYNDNRIEEHEFESRIYEWLNFLDFGYGYLKEENEGKVKFAQFIKKYEKKYSKHLKAFSNLCYTLNKR